MEIAVWLNNFFGGFDQSILSFYHLLAETVGVVLTPFMKLITLVGEKGLLTILLAVVLVLFPKTRKAGLCIAGAILCGALITNVALKDFIQRARPMDASAEFNAWWQFVGAPAEDGFSFPSGHVTAAMAGICALVLSVRKKYIWTSFAYVLVMAVSRNYLMAHYPSDVLAAMVVGLIAAVVAYFVAKYIFVFLEKYKSNKFFAFILEFDIRGRGKHQ